MAGRTEAEEGTSKRFATQSKYTHRPRSLSPFVSKNFTACFTAENDSGGKGQEIQFLFLRTSSNSRRSAALIFSSSCAQPTTKRVYVFVGNRLQFRSPRWPPPPPPPQPPPPPSSSSTAAAWTSKICLPHAPRGESFQSPDPRSAPVTEQLRVVVCVPGEVVDVVAVVAVAAAAAAVVLAPAKQQPKQHRNLFSDIRTTKKRENREAAAHA